MNYEVQLAGTVYLTLPTYNTAGAATNAAALPTYAIWDYDLSAQMASGTGTLATVSDSITGWYFGSHSILAASGYAAGKQYPVRYAYTIGSTSYAEYGSVIVY